MIEMRPLFVISKAEGSAAMVADAPKFESSIAAPSGGYDDGYASCPCFWGKSPGSLVRSFLTEHGIKSMRVLDLGCGEGKNAFAFAEAGASVTAVDCSQLALNNGKAAFGTDSINWVQSDSTTFLRDCDEFDVVVMYGLLHCMGSRSAIYDLIGSALRKTVIGGYHIVVAFNDGPHDLSAHPNFEPILVSHDFYVSQYARHQILSHESSVIHETHPHNGIPHFHSLTRLMARKTQ
jgi:tellurite methyltransferase